MPSTHKTWRTAGLALLIITLMIGATAALAAQTTVAPATSTETINNALDFIATKQLADGGIEGWTAGTADHFTTIKTILALSAANVSIESLTSVSGTTPLDYLATSAITYTHDLSGTLLPGRAGMLATAVVAGDADPTAFGGMDLVGEIAGTYQEATGAYSTTAQVGFSTGAANATNQLWAMLSLAAAQVEVPQNAVDFMVGLQEADGGWGYGFGGDIDTTALVIQALLANGMEPTATPIQEGLAFLKSSQEPTGGWASWGNLSADSTAAVIQALAAVGYGPTSSTWMTAQGGDPISELIGLQAADGSFGNALGTAHAIAGLAEAPLPRYGLAQRAELALAYLHDLQTPEGYWTGFSGPDAGATADAVLAYAAAGYDPNAITAPGSITSAVEALAALAPGFVEPFPDRAGKVALAAVVAGADPADLSGVDLVATLTEQYSPTLSAFGIITNTWHQAWGILGWAATGNEVPTATVEHLLGLQQPDGGWKYDLSSGWWATTAPDHTALAMQAALAAGVPPTSTEIIGAVDYMRRTQDANGGWGDANTTAYAMQGLLAAGEDLRADWQVDGRSPYQALAALQKPDGPFVWKWDNPWGAPIDSALATLQAVPALLGKTLYELPTAAPVDYEPVRRSADADRTVAAPLRTSGYMDEMMVTMPFGSDVDQDASVVLNYRLVGADWMTATAPIRSLNYFTSTMTLMGPDDYEIQATFADADGVQYMDQTGTEMVVTAQIKADRVYLPAVMGQQ